MALSEDQKKLLKLLAKQDEAYEAIAAATGADPDDLRARAAEAIEALDEEASEEARSAAGPAAAANPPSPAAGEAPAGVAPPTPPPAATPPAPVSRPAQPKPNRQLPLPRSRRRLAELLGGALLVLLLVLFATGAIDIGGGDSDSDDGGAGGGASPAANANANQLTQATLEPTGGGEGSGRALFGRVGKNPVLQIQAEGLEPSPPGESYTVWLYRSPKLALRVGALKVGSSGGLAAQLPIPLELLGLVANGSFTEIRVALTPDAVYKAEVARAKGQNRLPRYSGETVLAGEISGPPAAEQR